MGVCGLITDNVYVYMGNSGLKFAKNKMQIDVSVINLLSNHELAMAVSVGECLVRIQVFTGEVSGILCDINHV